MFLIFPENFNMLLEILKIMTPLQFMRKEKYCELALLLLKGFFPLLFIIVLIPIRIQIWIWIGIKINKKSDSDPNRHQNDADPQNCLKSRKKIFCVRKSKSSQNRICPSPPPLLPLKKTIVSFFLIYSLPVFGFMTFVWYGSGNPCPLLTDPDPASY
jgi:hypothetical protein